MNTTARRIALLAAPAIFALATALPASAQQTRLPAAEPPMPYVVRTGDTLIDLARDYLLRPSDYQRVQRENRIADPRRLVPGRTINFPIELLRTRPDPARLESFRGNVQITRGNQQLTLQPGTALAEGDLISTGNNAFARVALSDGSFAVVPSNSRVRLERLRRFEINDQPDHQIKVESGRLESSVTPRQRPGSYRVTTPSAVSAVRGTDFRVAYDAATGRSSTGVLEGSVQIGSLEGDSSILAGAGEGAVIAGGSVIGAALLASPSLDDPSQVHTAPSVDFTVSSPSGTTTVRGVVANDAGMSDLLAESETNGTSLVFNDLPEGRLFVRLTGLSADGLEGRGRTYNFVRALNGVEGLAFAQGGADRMRTYRFGWRAVGEGEATFRFQLWRVDENGQQVGSLMYDQPALTENNYTLTDLPPGDYAWRVQGVRHRFGERLAAWSQPELLTISN